MSTRNAPTPVDTTVTSTIPARIDRLPWSRFHSRLMIALGACWVLDGLETVIFSNIGVHLAHTIHLSPTEVGSLATVYLAGEVLGALLFGSLADRFGRRGLFFVTIGVYFGGSLLTVAVFGHGLGAFASVLATRFVAGIGIGGEYAAINSMVDELVPAPYRGRVDIALNGTYWAGAALAAAIQIPLLSGALDPGIDWRIAVVLGPAAAVGVVFLRRHIPESPRWQLFHGRGAEAETTTCAIEDDVRRTAGPLPAVPATGAIHVRSRPPDGYATLLFEVFRRFPGRAVLAATLLITQSVLYNAIFFNYAEVLIAFHGVAESRTAVYYLWFALANLLGPLVLGPLFDIIGRRRMISRTYLVSALLLFAGAFFFEGGQLTTTTHTLAWCAAFFFTSAGASSAYLTIGEVFPMEVRAKAVAAFFALGQGVGAGAPLLFGVLVDPGAPDPRSLVVAFVAGAALMLVGGVVAQLLAVDAENRSLEDVARPLSLVESQIEVG